ncbi:hypothetical protein [Ensifer adhaerens]|nr:hypothetical protein [Ensifer adhaerens]
MSTNITVATREGHDCVSIQPFAGMPPQLCEAAVTVVVIVEPL